MVMLILSLFTAFFVLLGWGIYLEHEVRHWDEKIVTLRVADDGRTGGLRAYERVMALKPTSGRIPMLHLRA